MIIVKFEDVEILDTFAIFTPTSHGGANQFPLIDGIIPKKYKGG